jgi:hypothetical protein
MQQPPEDGGQQHRSSKHANHAARHREHQSGCGRDHAGHEQQESGAPPASTAEAAASDEPEQESKCRMQHGSSPDAQGEPDESG